MAGTKILVGVNKMIDVEKRMDESDERYEVLIREIDLFFPSSFTSICNPLGYVREIDDYYYLYDDE